MKFRVNYTSDCFDDEEQEIELNSLEELMKFIKKSGYSVIVHHYTDEPTLLEVYDGWRE